MRLFIIAMILTVSFSACQNESIKHKNETIEPKSGIIVYLNELSQKAKVSELDIFFDSLGYAWLPDMEQKDSIIKYKSRDTLVKAVYFVKLQNNKIDIAGYSTDSSSYFLNALHETKINGFKEEWNDVDTVSVKNSFIKGFSHLIFEKSKLPETKMHYIIMSRYQPK